MRMQKLINIKKASMIQAFSKTVVKKEGTDDFTTLKGVKRNQYKYILLGEDDALYLYGGRKALIENLTVPDDRNNMFTIKGENGEEELAIFHDKISVSGGKTKRILMIAQTRGSYYRPSVLKAKKISVDLIGKSIHAKNIIDFLENLLKG